MNTFLLLLTLLVGTCLATPIQPQPQEGRQFRDEIRSSDGIVYGKYGFQEPTGGLRIVKYTAGKDGINQQVDGQSGLTIAPQPIVWNSNEPIYVEPAPLTYGSIPNQRNQEPFLTERDQQRYLNIDESIEGREEVNDEVRPVVNNDQTAPKQSVELDPKDDQKVDVQPKQVVNNGEHPSLLVSGISPVNIQRSVLTNNEDQQQFVFPQVIHGQRRLVEPLPQQQQSPQQFQYAVKGRSLVQNVRPILGYGQSVIPRQHSVYQQVVQQQQLPISIEEHRVSPQGIQRQELYAIRPVHQQHHQQVVQQRVQQQHPQQVVQQQVVSQLPQQVVPKEWLRKPVYQLSGVKGGVQTPRQTNYQYFIQPVIPQAVNYDVFGQQQQQQVRQQQQLVQPVQQQQQLIQPQVFGGYQQQFVDQQVGGQVVVDQRKDQKVDHSAHVGHEQHVVVQPEVPKSDSLILHKHVIKTPVQVVSHVDRQHVVPVTGHQRIIGFQQIPQQQQQVYQQVGDQQTSYVPYIQQSIPVSDIQQYYSVISHQQPIQSYDQQYVSYPINGQQQQQQVPVEQPIQYTPVNDEQQQFQSGQAVQGVQQVRVQPQQDSVQDLRINPLSVDQRQQRQPTLLGVKSAASV